MVDWVWSIQIDQKFLVMTIITITKTKLSPFVEMIDYV
jgi:hypothetical protein